MRLLFVIAVGCALLAPSALAAVECGDVIASDKVLKRDLDCRKSDSVVGLEVGANDVSLDLGGHTILGKSTQAGVTMPGRSGVTVMNGSLRKFGVGVQVGAANESTLSKLAIKGSDEHGVHLQEAVDTTIKKSTIVASERNITVAGITSGTLIANNRVSAGEVGVDVMQGMNATIRDNFMTGSTEAAITVGGTGGPPVSTTAIEGNVLERSEGVGIRVHSSPAGVSIAENEVTESDDAGIEVFSGGNVDIRANVLLDNGYHGIHVLPLSGVENYVRGNVVKRSAADGISIGDTGIRIESNQAIANARYGIQSVSSNGEGNVARRNGEEPQCQPVSLCE